MSMVVGITLGRNGKDSWDDERLRISTQHTIVYKVIMTTGSGLSGSLDEDASEYDVSLVSGVPPIGAVSALIAGAYCIDRDFTEVGPAVWEVACLFDNSVRRADEADQDPWDLEPTWRWSSKTIEVPLMYDADDPTIAITNSAGERIIGATTPIIIPVLTIRRFELGFSESVILSYSNRRNEETFWGAAPDHALCAGITADPEKRDGVKYWSVEYIFEFNLTEYGWGLRLLDEGTYYLGEDLDWGERYPFGDQAFQQIVGNLNGLGGKNTTGEPAFVGPYNKYKKANFNDLNLGPWTWA